MVHLEWTWERASAIRKQGKEANEAEDDAPSIPIISQGSDLVCCGDFFTTSKESCKQTPCQTKDTSAQSANTKYKWCGKRQ